MTFQKFNFFSMAVPRWSIIALGTAIPLSTALDNLLLFVLLLAVLFSNSHMLRQRIVQNPVARASSLLFAALVLGMAYGSTPFREAFAVLGKYVDLAFVPLLMVAARGAETRRHATSVFVVTMLIIALLSWLLALNILPVASWMWRGGVPENAAIFRNSITQNVLMVYAAYLLILRAREASAPGIKWLMTGLAIFAVSSVLFVVQGKTGYLVLLALLAYFSWQLLARRLRSHGRSIGWHEGIGLGLLALALVAAVYQVSPRLHGRVDEMIKDFQAWQPNAHDATSTGTRLNFYYNTFALVKQRPVLGVGTGGFAAAYAQQVRDKGATLTRNPHSEYLLIMVQLGVAGLGLLLYLFYTLWRCAAHLPGLFEQDAARGLVLTIAITALFNSPLLDHTEGLFFAFMTAILFANLNSGNRHV